MDDIRLEVPPFPSVQPLGIKQVPDLPKKIRKNPEPSRTNEEQEKEAKDKSAGYLNFDQSSSQVSPQIKKRNRSASLVWVDYLTEDGIPSRDDLSPLSRRHSLFSTSDKFLSLPRPPRPSIVSFTTEDEDDLEEEEEGQGSNDESGPRRRSLISLQFRDRLSLLHRAACRRRSSLKSESGQIKGEHIHRNVDDLIFDLFEDESRGRILVGKFLSALEKTGLRTKDERLKELHENLRAEYRSQERSSRMLDAGSIETMWLTREVFKIIITDNIILISRAFRQQFIIPEFQMFSRQIEDLYHKCMETSPIREGHLPKLSRHDPNIWGVAICTVDGQRFSIGDTTLPFTLQSCCKPLTYAIALDELGRDGVHKYVGQENSGQVHNDLILDHNKKPHNPLANAGALIISSLLKSKIRPHMTPAEKFDFTEDYLKRLCGGEHVGFNNSAYLSKKDRADNVYALGFYLREHNCFPPGINLEDAMDFYLQCYSMESNCEALAVTAATLANGGICPTTGEKVLKSESVQDVLSLMYSCGLYDYSGQFAFHVGLPAKASSGGVIYMVVPGILGMALWSPPLAHNSNHSLRGVKMCRELVEMFNFRKNDSPQHTEDKIDPVRSNYETRGFNIVNLLFSAAAGDILSIQRHALSGMDMDASDYDGRTALHLAAAEGQLECVEYLLKLCRVNPGPVDRWGNLPVDDAKKFEHIPVVNFLTTWIERGN